MLVGEAGCGEGNWVLGRMMRLLLRLFLPLLSLLKGLIENGEWRTIEVYIIMSARVLLLWLALLTN